MTGTELTLREKTEQVIATLQLPAVLEQIEELLPDNVPMTRFVGVAKTAIRSNPDLVNADQTSLFAAIIRCAQAGLFPDGHEAALVIYKGKVSFLPMIDGVRKTLAEFGWLLRTGVVRENDEFEWSEEPMSITHRPARPGVERGQLMYAYGIATHADGRRLQRVLDRDEIAKRRAKAQTDKVWSEWEEAMWRKSAGHAVGGEVPLSEGDRARLDRVLATDTDPAAAAELLYGADGAAFTMTEVPATVEPPADTPSTDATAGPSGGSQQAGAAGDNAVPAPGDDDPEPVLASQQQELADAANVVAGTKIPNGANIGKTLAELAAEGAEGENWLGWALRHPGKFDDAFYAAVETFVQGALPQVWAEHAARAAA